MLGHAGMPALAWCTCTGSVSMLTVCVCVCVHVCIDLRKSRILKSFSFATIIRAGVSQVCLGMPCAYFMILTLEIRSLDGLKCW